MNPSRSHLSCLFIFNLFNDVATTFLQTEPRGLSQGGVTTDT